jgi:antitoxin (DNA-binding transcriptional repressor) of toxin-antitoxin stability system
MVQGGEDIVIERHGKPVARLVPVREKVKSPLGMMRGEFEMVEGWERPLTNEEADAFWEGRR